MAWFKLSDGVSHGTGIMRHKNNAYNNTNYNDRQSNYKTNHYDTQNNNRPYNQTYNHSNWELVGQVWNPAVRRYNYYSSEGRGNLF